jgi:hypothetical protein
MQYCAEAHGIFKYMAKHLMLCYMLFPAAWSLTLSLVLYHRLSYVRY